MLQKFLDNFQKDYVGTNNMETGHGNWLIDGVLLIRINVIWLYISIKLFIDLL